MECVGTGKTFLILLRLGLHSYAEHKQRGEYFYTVVCFSQCTLEANNNGKV